MAGLQVLSLLLLQSVSAGGAGTSGATGLPAVLERVAGAATADPATGAPTALHPMPASVPCNACGRPMQLKHARRSGNAFLGCSGFARHGCRFVRTLSRNRLGAGGGSTLAMPRCYVVSVVAEMETAGSFRLLTHPPRALRGIFSCLTLPARPPPLPQAAPAPASAGAGERMSLGDVTWKRGAEGHEILVLPLSAYSAVAFQLRHLAAVRFEGVPPATLRVFAGMDGDGGGATGPDVRRKLPAAMLHELAPYQIEGIEFIVRKSGRALLADEMGLGKSVQALGAALCLHGWPLLIVCPASCRLVWAEETERWLPGIAAGERLVVASSTDKPARSTPKIVIVSYKMLHRLRSDLLRRAWGMVFVCVQSYMGFVCEQS